ncbi:MAG TPA: DinB family protein [Pyrinomonadaceae bacterium]|nr:DinB family protein [Pyrinomonadaceae bacterium]
MDTHTAARPGEDEYPAYFKGYVSRVPEGDVLETLRRQSAETLDALRGVSEERAAESYEPGKWTIKELVGHVIDSERVFAYRALAIARGDTASLPSMDQDLYVANADFNSRTLPSLVDELERVRATTLDLLSNLDARAWARRGTANESVMSVRALAHIIAGHEAHHASILRERYLGREV